MQVWLEFQEKYAPEGVPFVRPTHITRCEDDGYELFWCRDDTSYVVAFKVKPDGFTVKYKTSSTQTQPWFEYSTSWRIVIVVLNKNLAKYYVGG